jgi:hypothetical protein
VALNLYRRHREACEAGRVFDSRSGEFEERKRDWKRCGCLIFASGTLGRKFSRRCLNTDDWAKARERAGEYEKRPTHGLTGQQRHHFQSPPQRSRG